MTDFVVSITDKYKLAGLAATREAKNNSLTPEKDEKGNDLPINTHPDYISTDQDYLQYVINSACEYYAKQFGYDPNILAQKTQELADLQAKMSKL